MEIIEYGIVIMLVFSAFRKLIKVTPEQFRAYQQSRGLANSSGIAPEWHFHAPVNLQVNNFNTPDPVSTLNSAPVLSRRGL